MGKAGKIASLACGVFAVVHVYGLYRDLFHNDCGLPEADARGPVTKELAKRGWPTGGLVLRRTVGSCVYEYDYHADGTRHNFAVLSTWGQGVKLTWQEYPQDGLPAP